MPRNYKLGTSPSKRRDCPFPGCTDSYREGKRPRDHHWITVHGITWKVYWKQLYAAIRLGAKK